MKIFFLKILFKNLWKLLQNFMKFSRKLREILLKTEWNSSENSLEFP